MRGGQDWVTLFWSWWTVIHTRYFKKTTCSCAAYLATKCSVLSSPLLTSPCQQVLSYILHIFAKSVFAERLTVSFSERKCISQICFLLRAANCCSDLPVLHVSSVFQISSKQRLTTNTKNTIVIFCPVVLYNTKRTHSWQYKGFSLWWKSSICLLVE